MFSLLVKYSGWADGRDSLPLARILEYTDDGLVSRFKPSGSLDLDALLDLPAVFMEESHGGDMSPAARVGTILRARASGTDVILDYTYDAGVPPLKNETIEGMTAELGIDDWEFTRTHWAVKDADLFRALLRNVQPKRSKPRVFSLYEPERIEPSLVSAMMPFSPAFDAVYETLKKTAEGAGLHCRRADDIWENPAIIQDVVSLIDRSKVVICDCTGRNPNVFYEVGIAHTLGREVILITQAASDIPFDLRHLRYVSYLNNGEGRAELAARLSQRLSALAATA